MSSDLVLSPPPSSSEAVATGADTVPRKRPRMTSPLNDHKPEIPTPMSISPIASTSSNMVVRDDKYYMSDGSCIIRIEDTLFNVHRTLLARDSSSFSILFTLPQGDYALDGSSDEHPVILRGDTVEEFRSFLWAMYALPHELKLLFDTQADVTKLLDIAKVANKYSFHSLETWACDALQEFVSRRPSAAPTSTSSFSADTNSDVEFETDSEATHRSQLTRIIRLAQLCGHERLQRKVVTVLQQHMHSSPAYLALALELADELDVPALTGSAYFAVLLRGSPVSDSVSETSSAPPLAFLHVGDSAESDFEAALNTRQRLRLLNGYYNLTRIWERLRSSPPTFTHAPGCGVTWSQGQCRASWEEFWRKQVTGEKLMKLSLADVSGRLRAVLKEMDRWGPWGQQTLMHHECRQEVKKALHAEIKKFESNLTEYFPPV